MAEPGTTFEFQQPVPVCPVRGPVLYPTLVMPVDAGAPGSIRAINAALGRARTVAVGSQQARDVEEPAPDGLHGVGTACNIVRMEKSPAGTRQMLVRACARVRVHSYKHEDGLIEAE